MRWDDLFADLEAQAQALLVAERDAEVAELTRLETSRLELASRLRPALGAAVRTRCLGGMVLAGRLSAIGTGWLLLDEDAGREAFVATAAVVSIAGLGRLSAPGSALDARLGIGRALRGLARDRSVLRACLIDSTVVDGTLDRVGSDFVEFAVHAAGEPRRREEVREVLVLPIAALAVLRRDN
ncbi:hypothetical protein [Jatrophihabitans sp.]|jgi:hypothetical protein|uniref:hypothetical protein n=1 Tax=Jatrophihabitans sp. TaxID=1932789 RepID=UPI002F129736